MYERTGLRRSRRILLADDDEAIQEAVRRASAKLGHQLIGARTGTGAIQLAAAAQPDLIVLDIGFPDLDGRDVLARLKSDVRTARIPVLVWSGRKVNDSDSRIALALGAEDYVEKSDAELLMGKIERLLFRLYQD
jgi:CheY-like chemotaxis protein